MRNVEGLVSELAASIGAFHPDRHVRENRPMFHVVSPRGAVLFFREPEDLEATQESVRSTLTHYGADGKITLSSHGMPVPSARYRGKPPYQLYLSFEGSGLEHALWLRLLDRYVNPEEHAYHPLGAQKTGFMFPATDRDLIDAHRCALENNQKTITHLESVSESLAQGRLSPQARDFLHGKSDPRGQYAQTQAHADALIGRNPLLCGHPRVVRTVWEVLSEKTAKFLEKAGLMKHVQKRIPRLELLAEVELQKELDDLVPLGSNDRKHALAERKNMIQQVLTHLDAQQDYNRQALDALARPRP